MIKVDIFNNFVSAEILNIRSVPGVNYYRLFSEVGTDGGVDFGENNILYEAGNSMVGYNYFIGHIDTNSGRYIPIFNWITKERMVYEE